jgi:hypothetical protein
MKALFSSSSKFFGLRSKEKTPDAKAPGSKSKDQAASGAASASTSKPTAPQRNRPGGSADSTLSRPEELRPQREDTFVPSRDTFLSPALMHGSVANLNRQHPEMNARFAPDFKTMLDGVAAHMKKEHAAPMHIITANVNGHYSAWRFQKHEGRVIAIGIDSTARNSEENFSNFSEFDQQSARHPGLIKGGLLLGTGAQKDKASCGVYAMGFLNTFRKHQGHFDELAGDVSKKASGQPVERLRMESREGLMLPNNEFELLPAHAYKNTQSRVALKTLFENAPDLSNQPVTKMGDENIVDRLQRFAGAGGVRDPLNDRLSGMEAGKIMNSGIEKKHEKLLSDLGMPLSE